MTPEHDKMRKALSKLVAPDLLEETVRAALGALPTAGTITPPRRCQAQASGDRQCIKNVPHGSQHRYGPRAVNPSIHTPVVRDWTRVPQVPIVSGSKTFTLKVGGPCTLLREGSTKVHGFKVLHIEKHPDGRVNVEIGHAKKHVTRIVPLDRIEYRRPKKEA